MSGIRNSFRLAANVVKTSNTTLITTGLSSVIAPLQKMHFRWWVPFTEAAGTAGIKFLAALTQTATLFTLSFFISNLVATHVATDNAGLQLASGTNFTGTGANAGNYLCVVELDIVNGSTAGVVDLQFAQNVSDAGATTVLAGSYLETVVL